MSRCRLVALVMLILIVAWQARSGTMDSIAGPPDPEAPVSIVVHDRVLHPVSPLLFGQFMEDAGDREPGPQSAAALIPGTGTFRPEVLEQLRRLRATVIRFPGGFMAERHNRGFDYRLWLPGPVEGWPEPEPTGDRRRFGLIEFFAACEELDAEPMLVVPCRPAFQRAPDPKPERTVEQTAEFAAGLVAFANATSPEDVPERLRAWVRLRHDAGRPEPANVKYWQIGNEWWLFRRPFISDGGWTEEEFNARHVEVVDAVSRAMRAVDPDIVLITDAVKQVNAQILALKPGIDWLSSHQYSPHDSPDFALRDGQRVPIEALSAEEHWRLLTAMPYCDADGRSMWRTDRPALSDNDAPLAFTEWNWNGWGPGVFGHPEHEPSWSMGVGVAGFLHAILRSGDRAQVATQSMMVGSRWGITAVRVSDEHPPRLTTKGRVTAFYARHHGDRRLAVDDSDVPVDAQPYRMGVYTRPEPKVKRVDVVATATDDRVFVHLIHRGFDQPIDLSIDLSEVMPASHRDGSLASMHLMIGTSDLDLDNPALSSALAEVIVDENIRDGVAKIRLPAKSIAIVELRTPRRMGTKEKS
ncbi:MAG: hypothetical protein AAFY08_01350 [Planctomycetota bacterium]